MRGGAAMANLLVQLVMQFARPMGLAPYFRPPPTGQKMVGL